MSRERTPANGAASSVPQKLETPPVQDWQGLYQEHFEAIYRYIYSKVGNREEAEDLTEQTFIKAVRSIDYTRSAHSLQTWLFRTARTTIADYWRAYYRLSIDSLEVLLDAGWEGPVASQEAINVQSNLTAYVHTLLACLPSQYREVLNCRFLLNLSVRETAATLSLTEANVKVLQFRALKHAAVLAESVVGSRNPEGGE